LGAGVVSRAIVAGAVAEAMITGPATHAPSATVAELRAFFRDDHVHMVLLVDQGKLLGTVERPDLAPHLTADTAALSIMRLDGRTTAPDAPLPDVLASMKRDGRRRLAVTSTDHTLVGLLCLKAGGSGFCSDSDVWSRRSPERSHYGRGRRRSRSASRTPTLS
jgi:predicted transcriptional regulator